MEVGCFAGHEWLYQYTYTDKAIGVCSKIGQIYLLLTHMILLLDSIKILCFKKISIIGGDNYFINLLWIIGVWLFRLCIGNMRVIISAISIVM